MNEQDISISFEFFPPKTEAGLEKLVKVRDTLSAFAPSYFSVTYGAGGSTRDNTKDVILRFKRDGFDVAPHLSVGGDNEAKILELLQEYKAAGINRLVALRGDMPSGMGTQKMVYANQLVEMVRAHFGDHFAIKVAAYPEIHPDAKSYDDDIRYLKGKFDAGADAGITQYFYNPDAFFYFMDQCQAAGIDRPIFPGIMPILNYKNLARFSASCGAEIPRWLARRLESFGDDTESLQAFSTDLVTELCETLLENGAPGLHFYSMNQAEPCATICRNLGLIPVEA